MISSSTLINNIRDKHLSSIAFTYFALFNIPFNSVVNKTSPTERTKKEDKWQIQKLLHLDKKHKTAALCDRKKKKKKLKA